MYAYYFVPAMLDAGLHVQEVPTDLENRTGLSIYFWETEVNGGHAY